MEDEWVLLFRDLYAFLESLIEVINIAEGHYGMLYSESSQVKRLVI